MKRILSMLFMIVFLAGCLAQSAAVFAGEGGSGELYDGQVILDLTFDDGTVGNFFSYTNGGSFDLLNQDQQLACHIKKTGSLDYANQAYLDGFALVEGCRYKLSFDAFSDAACSVQYRIQLNGGDYHAYVMDQAVMTAEPLRYEIEFVMEEPTDPAPRLAFNMGMQADMQEDPGEHTIYFDNIRLEVIDASQAVQEQKRGEQVLLSVNHVGYRPADIKTVVTDGTLAGKEFEIKDAAGNKCFTGTFSEAKDDKATKKSLCRGDFSELTEPGSYMITVQDGGQEYSSQTFEIAENVYEELTQAVFRMLLLQRCGMELDEETAGEFAHPACHMEPAVVYGTEKYKDVSGGWHDAGDYGRYVVSGAKTLADILYIYENISRDEKLLGEARYELEWMLKMQDEETGGVYHKVTCANFPGTVMPQEETQQLILSPVSAAATADFAAVMAKASGIYRQADGEFARECALAAMHAWEYLQSQDTFEGFTNPEGIVTGEYPDEKLDDEILWAAVELWNMEDPGTGGAGFRNELADVIREKTETVARCGMDWSDVSGYAFYDLAKTGTDDEEFGKYVSAAKDVLLTTAQALINIIERDGYGASLGTRYHWGSNMQAADNGFLLLMAGDLSGDESFATGAKKQLDYLLGVNGLDFCFVSGEGDRSLSDPHHRPSQAVGKSVPGMLAGGPNADLEDPYAQQVLQGRAPALCYADNAQSYSTNEVAIYWNSPLLVLLCAVR